MKNIIKSERLILRPWKLDDLQANVDGLNEYDVAKNLTTSFPYTLENAQNFINSRIENPNTREKSYFAIVEKSSGKVIGGTNIEITEKALAKGGIWLNKNFHGKGYGTEAMCARIKYCFDKLNVDYLENGFLEGNEISWRMQKKLGYKLTGEKSELNCPARGGLATEIKTKLTKEDFLKAIQNIKIF